MFLKPEHIPYLKQQHGRIGEFKHDDHLWVDAYLRSIEQIFENIKPYIPHNVHNVLDIGGGFSGISTKLDPEIYLTVIDGLHDQAKRARTYNDAGMGMEFLRLNGIENVEYFSPEGAHHIEKKFDLIYSFAAYPFHIKPEVYEELLIKNSHKDTVFILEVRRGWNLPKNLKWIKVIFEEKKYARIVAQNIQ